MGQRISVRLDANAAHALRSLEASGLTRSEALRRSLIEAAGRTRPPRDRRAEAKALDADGHDRTEMLHLAAFMDQSATQ